MRQLLKKILPPFAINKLKRVQASFHRKLTPFFSKSPFLSRIYFTFLNSSYHREQFANLRGMMAYKQRINEHKNSSNPLLRRNIHRIEKGLIMKPLKPVFALDYIEQTQQIYFASLKSTNHQPEELQWAGAVLAKYYNVVKIEQSDLLLKLANEFKANVEVEFENINQFTPYSHSELVKPKFTYQEFYRFIKIRRSTRWFKQAEVCREKIKQAIELASQAPSACNRQPYQFFVVDKQPLVSKISKLAIGSGGFAHNIPTIVAVVGDYSFYEHERDRHVIYIDASLAAMQFMQALPTLGLSSCPLNWPELSVQDRKISKLLSLAEYKKVIMLIAVGEAETEGGIPYSQKKTAEQLTHFVE
ncbi:nitroreductase family protein [Litorilituus lipolyticus]|uniref:Nitroreductase family protein n=1 Tax=Litorilituus lipolyticus TaxID=2491017 RepID=A0A502L4X7_9GAMM|nr:nitroreductase family protein [Litorilituus lipolyticus]TPH18978.1 nitroreductase family protein [Litorilituus lipolyticus]